MIRSSTALHAVCCFLAILVAGCAAEKLDTRDPHRGPAGDQSHASPIVHPTDLQTTEQQIAAHAPPPAEPVPARGEDLVYVCPMHPEVQSAHPGSCPKCGMTLVRKQSSP
ncbi:MAG: heavy metal-binding domain-containing protein [Polyangia bacterium]